MARELSDLKSKHAALEEEHENVWRALELEMGCPYQHLENGQERWMEELKYYLGLVHEGLDIRMSNGTSLYCEQEKWLAEQERLRKQEEERVRLAGKDFKSKVLARDGHACVSCGIMGVRLECDHIIPWIKGGLTILENMQTLCRPCNMDKGDLMPEEWEAKKAARSSTR